MCILHGRHWFFGKHFNYSFISTNGGNMALVSKHRTSGQGRHSARLCFPGILIKVQEQQ